MNREETRKAAEVMLHYANGGEVQYKNYSHSAEWECSADPRWNWDILQYRIKPQPVEVTCWAVVRDVLTRNWSFHETQQLAMARLRELKSNCELDQDAFVVELKGTYTCDT